MLELQNIGKKYKDLQVLDQVDLSFGVGLYGLLGENGAGKSTLIKILTMNLPADEGVILYEGKDIQRLGAKYRQQVGYVPQNSVGYTHMQVLDFMKYMASVKGLSLRKKETMQQIKTLLEQVHMWDEKHKKYGQLSGGMKRRVLLAQALLGNPGILILDEPTAGLDPKERMDMKNFIAKQALTRTVLLATHIITDVECEAKNIVFMKRGEIPKSQSTKQWIAQTEGHVGRVLCTESELSLWQKKYIVSSICQQEKGVEIKVVAENLRFDCQIQPVVPNLEDAYAYHVILT